MKKVGWILVLFVVFLAGCKKDDPIVESIDFGYGFFPLTIGDSSIFEVKQTTWNDFNHTVDSVNYFLCEYIESVTVNSAGDSLYRIERLNRDSVTSDWTLDRVWYALKNKKEALRVEENITFTKIVFPIKLNDTWNGNYHNTLGEKTYTCIGISSAVINSIPYSRTVSIQQENFVSLINSDIEKEVYADGVGLVELSKTHVNKSYNPSSGNFEIKSGYIYSQKRIR
jgi:hypothetical protein